MKTTHTLIVNRNGLLSACPSHAVYAAGAFLTDPERFLVCDVRIHPATYLHLYKNRDSAYVLHPDLPGKTTEPGRIYYKVQNGHLVKA